MTAEVGLTDAEREALLCDCGGLIGDACPIHTDNLDLWIDVPAAEIELRVERIVREREAKACAEALRSAAEAIEAERADFWRQTGGLGFRGAAGYERACDILNERADQEAAR